MTTPINTMHLEAIQEQFSNIPLFACLYVDSSKRKATYAVTKTSDESTDFNQVLYSKTVNVVTGDTLDEYSTFPSVLTLALGHHFNAKFIQEEAVTMSFELIENIEDYMTTDGKLWLHKHEVFGQSVYYTDLMELHIRCTDKLLHVITRHM